MLRQSYHRTTRIVAIVLLTLTAAAPPCTVAVNAAEPATIVTAPRQLVTDPMTWLVRTDRDWSPVEQAQPTLWIEGVPTTRYTVDRPGMERAFRINQGDR